MDSPKTERDKLVDSNAFASSSNIKYLQESANDEEFGENSHWEELSSCAFLSDFVKRRWVSICSCTGLVIAIVLVVGFTGGDTTATTMMRLEDVGTTTTDNSESNLFNTEKPPHWPSQLFHRVANLPGLPKTNTPWPTNTMEAALARWSRVVDDECIPELGQVWLHEGKRTPMSSVALFFSPQVGNIPGELTGIEVNYYGRILEGLVGSYFSEERLDKDSVTYHSVAVGFRDWREHNLCDSGNPLPAVAEKYLAVAPQLANIVVPTVETDSRLIEEWHEGSCLEGMGYHWFKNVIPGSAKLTYKSNTVMPVVVMFHPDTRDISGLFFWAPQRMQVWNDDVCNSALAKFDMETLPSCFSDMNFWDPGPGLMQRNDGPLIMCANTCDVDCWFEDSSDGTINTMHFFFYSAAELKCPSGSVGNESKYCRNGFDFTGWSQESPE